MNKIKSIWIYAAVVFCLSVIVVVSWDDFFWAGSQGMSQLHNHFSGYNGRYVGNLLIMGITRSTIFRVFCYTLTNVGIAVVMHKLFSNQMKMRYIILILLTIPIGIFKQTYGWFSGFANYNVSSLLILLLFYIILKCDFKWYLTILMAALAFISQFFAENVSIGNVIISFLAIIVCSFINRKKLLLAVSWLIGSTAGFWLMFQNAAYRSEGDRGTANIYFSELYKHLVQDWSELVIKNNVFLIIIFSVVIFLVLNKPKLIGLYLLLFNVYFIGRDYLNISFYTQPLYMLLGELILILIFVGVLIYTGFKALNQEEKIIYFSFLVSGIIMVSPFLIVTPFGPRNILLTYLMLSVSLGVLWLKLLAKIEINYIDKFTKLAIVGLSLFVLFIYSVNWFENYRRIEKIEVADKRGNKEVEIRRLPFSFLGQALDDSFYSDDRIKDYKEYYGISSDIEIKIVDRQKPLPWRQTNN